MLAENVSASGDVVKVGSLRLNYRPFRIIRTYAEGVMPNMESSFRISARLDSAKREESAVGTRHDNNLRNYFR